jgi:hypothetical protein
MIVATVFGLTIAIALAIVIVATVCYSIVRLASEEDSAFIFFAALLTIVSLALAIKIAIHP